MMEIHVENSNELLHNRFPEKSGNGLCNALMEFDRAEERGHRNTVLSN